MIGWTLLSREQVARAQAALKTESQGVVDEVGLLALHQGFADRFFPGTSVLHTRLRYAFFVPWAVMDSEGDPAQLRKIETKIVEQLAQGWNDGFDPPKGIIGIDTLPRAPSQPPSTAYWGAVSVWGLLRKDAVVQGRSAVLKSLAAQQRSRTSVRKVDGELINAPDASPFVDLPPRPENWLRDRKPLGFELTQVEQELMRKHWLGLWRDANPQLPSVLAQLADLSRRRLREVVGGASPDGLLPVLEDVDASERRMLLVARRAALLACVCRAMYAALVEAECERERIGDGSAKHQALLARHSAAYGDEIRALDIDEIQNALPTLPVDVVSLMRLTRDWLVNGAGSIAPLWESYQRAEARRKGGRARLTRSLQGRRRRTEWDPAAHPVATPLHYRWPNVRRLLADLAGA